jgi:CheY-like chemotaxis protein
VPKTLLAVDDSATMRKVLEITFGGDDYRVITAENAQAALGKLGEEPQVVVIDTVLGGDDGYALSKEVRRRDGGAVIVLLSSRHNPYDQAKGADAGADDFMDKPFDTQQMADKVKKAIAAREGGGARAPVAAAPPPAPPPMARPVQPSATPAPPQVAAAAAPPKAPAGRANTLMFGGDAMTAKPALSPAPTFAAPKAAPPAAPPQQASRMPMPATQAPSPQPPRVVPAAAPSAPAPVAAVARATTKVNGHLTDKLGELGLTQQQVDAVLALSRDVIERVVWEVVPELAETLIKEEITRLTKA